MELGGIIIVICMIIGFAAWCFEYGDFCDGFVGALAGGLAGIFLSLFLCGLVLPIVCESCHADTELVVVEEQELVALKDTSGISGSFFLGCGSIESDQYIYYVAYEEGKGYSVSKKSTDSAYIAYLSDENCKYNKPTKVEYKEDWKSRTLRFITWAPSWWTTFYVPEGSVIENYYEVDLTG